MELSRKLLFAGLTSQRFTFLYSIKHPFRRPSIQDVNRCLQITMSEQGKAAVLIVTGAYFLPDAWKHFRDDLTEAGFVSSCPRLPTCGDVRPPKATVEDDVKAVRDAATELVKAGHPIIVLAHSYGGIVASDAISADLYAKDPSSPGVVHLIYLAAMLFLPGNSLGDVLGKYGFLSKADMGINEDGTVQIKNTPDSFYNDVEPDHAKELSESNVTHNSSTMTYKVSHAPWKALPTTYIYCAKDMAFFFELQQAMVKDAMENGAADLGTVTCDTGHCAFLTAPAEVIRIVENAWSTSRSK